MRTAIIAFPVSVFLFCGSAFAGNDRSAADGERWLSIPQIHAKLEAAGYRNIEKIEREHGSYEVKATDREGRRVKLYVNPQTGDIDDRHGSRRDRFERSDTRRSADCNERRCRDDLPQRAAPRQP